MRNAIEHAVSTGLCTLAKMDYDARRDARYYYKVVDTPGVVIELTLELAKILGVRPPLPLMIEPADAEDFDIEHSWKLYGLHIPELPKSIRNHVKAASVSSTIYVRNRSLGKMIGTIAHEVRHAWQLANGYYKKEDSNECEAYACAFQAAVLKAFKLPDYADLVIDVGGPPLKYGTAGSAFGLFHYDYKSGNVSAAIGDMPWPRWRWHSRVDLSGGA